MKRTIIIIICFTVLIVLLYGVFSLALFETSAQYTDYKELNHYFESKELYLSSEQLSYQENKYNIINYYDFTPISFEINNSISDHQITNYNVEYNLTCNILDNLNTSYDCIIDDTDHNNISDALIINKQCLEDNTLSEEECLLKKYNYNLIKTTNNHTFKIINKNGNAETIKVEIVLNTTSPYSKTLKATYILNVGNSENNDIKINEPKDYNSFCEYTIDNNYYTDKNIKLTIDTNKLIFDTTSDIYTNKISSTTDNNVINTITFILKNNQSIKLFKKDFNYQCNTNDINYLVLE